MGAADAREVREPRWFGYPGGTAHAFVTRSSAIPEASDEKGRAKAICPARLVASRLSHPTEKMGRCKLCVKQTAPPAAPTRKASWRGHAGSLAHAFVTIDGKLQALADAEGRVKALCPERVKCNGLVTATRKALRCEACVKKARSVDATVIKIGRGMGERFPEVTDSGAYVGDPASAEKRRRAEISAISGDALKSNKKIVKALRAGDEEKGRELARELDARGPAAEVPTAPNASAPKPARQAGGRGVVGRDDPQNSSPGPAVYRGRDMTGVVPRPRKDGAGPARDTMCGPTGRVRTDRRITDGAVDIVGGRYGYLTGAEYRAMSKTRKRRYWETVKRNAGFAEAARKVEKEKSGRLAENIAKRDKASGLTAEQRERARRAAVDFVVRVSA